MRLTNISGFFLLIALTHGWTDSSAFHDALPGSAFALRPRAPPKSDKGKGTEPLAPNVQRIEKTLGKKLTKTEAGRAAQIPPEAVEKQLGIAEETKPESMKMHQFDKDHEVVKGETGFQVKESTDKKHVFAFIYYGDKGANAMPFHAYSVYVEKSVHPWSANGAYEYRDVQLGHAALSRGKTVDAPDVEIFKFGGVEQQGMAADEEPARQFNYANDVFTVVGVTKFESNFQGNYITKARNEALRIAKDGQRIYVQQFDNRLERTIPNSKQRFYVKGPESSAPDIGTPEVVVKPLDKQSQNHAYTFVIKIPDEDLPPAHRSSQDLDAEMGNTKRSPWRRSNTGQWESKRTTIVHAPMYNLQMGGDDAYTVANIQKLLASNSEMKRSVSERAHSPRGVLDTLENEQSNASDASEMSDTDLVSALLDYKSELQINGSGIIIPYVNAVLNGSSSYLAEAQAWNLWSLLSPDISVISPFLGRGDMLGDSGQPEIQDFLDSIATFNAFVYTRAEMALNTTGLLQQLNKIDQLLITFNSSLYPNDPTTFDPHTVDPFEDFLQEWRDYNGFSNETVSGSNYSANATAVMRKTPDWVWTEFDFNSYTGSNGTNSTSSESTLSARAPAVLRQWPTRSHMRQFVEVSA